MKRLGIMTLAALLVALMAQTAMAQRPDGGRGGDRRGDRGGDRGGRGGFPGFSNPIMEALDADRDGELSADEIKNAASALAKLDTNKNGKLDRDELNPRRGRGGFGGGPGGPGGPGAGGFADRIMGFDENKDGKVTKDELPERMQRMLDRIDSNGDGAIDRQEIEAMASQFGGRGGPGSGRGGRGGGEGGGRPQRPQRPL